QSAGLYARMAEDLRARAGIRCARAGGTISATGVCAGIGEAGMRTKALAVWLLSAIDALRLRDADGLARDRRALRLAEIWASAAKSREAELSEIASRGFADPGRVLALAAEPLLGALELALRAFRLFGGCGFWDASGGQDAERGKNAGNGMDAAHA
ncbi:MAG: hypothetical protein J5863_06115, partial [Desulfovibrio sp.]|nr:hypothetical protein [Desulfovibrio sp.]